MTDFARNWTKENKHFSALMRESVIGALERTGIAPEEIESAHVGNFAAELYCMQGHLGAFFTEVHPAFSGLPTSRHEAACASGSIALLAAGAEIEAGRYDLQAVVGIEQMKTVSAAQGGSYLGTAAWYDQEAKGVEFPFPKLFGRLGDEYDKRYGLKDEHLAEISKINYANAKKNPNAQTRTWYMNKEHALCRTDDNPAVGGRIRIADCSQVTDGAVCVFLASREYAEKYAKGIGRSSPTSRDQGLGPQHGAPALRRQGRREPGNRYVLPHVRSTITSAMKRAGSPDVSGIDAIETHDCFTTSEYMAIDHFGITAPGESWKAVEAGWLEIDGKIPINPSGGLIGAGHPVGAPASRQLLDAVWQVTGEAGDYQVEGAKNVQTLNIGGSGTTSVSFIVGV
jgi:acetyl-CoA C-acetyltransferase